MPIAKITKNSYTIDSLYQWDLNQVLEIYGLSLPTTPEIHFANPTMELAIVRNATMDEAGVIRVDVPNSLLQKSQKINAYVCIYEGESFRSICKLVIPVIGRARPSDYAGEDENEVYSLDALGVEVITLSPGEDARVEKVLQGDKWILRFSIPLGNSGQVSSGSVSKIGEVTLLASAWSGSNKLYSQVVSIDGVTKYSQVDLTPSVEQLVVFYEKDLTFVAENENGVVTVYAIGQKPTNDYTIQVTITEVNV